MEIIKLHSDTPHQRSLKQIADKLKAGGIAILPTDSVYAIVCTMSSKKSIDKIISITGKKEKKAKMSLLCKDISTVSQFTMPINNHIFKTMKRYTPGPYTFILDANNFTQKFFKNSKKDIGIRIVNMPILEALHEHLDEPLISTSLNMKNEQEKMYVDPDVIVEDFQHDVDIIVDGGIGHNKQSTILDCRDNEIDLIRQGEGVID